MNNKSKPKRPARIQINLTDDELNLINRKAKDCGMNTSTFARFILLKSEIKVE